MPTLCIALLCKETSGALLMLPVATQSLHIATTLYLYHFALYILLAGVSRITLPPCSVHYHAVFIENSFQPSTFSQSIKHCFMAEFNIDITVNNIQHMLHLGKYHTRVAP